MRGHEFAQLPGFDARAVLRTRPRHARSWPRRDAPNSDSLHNGRLRKIVARRFSPSVAVAPCRCAHGSSSRNHVYCSLWGRPAASAVRAGCGLGRYFCRPDRPASRMACVPAEPKRSPDCMDLEYDRNRGFDRRCRIRSNVIARSIALDFRGTHLGHHDNAAVALDPGLFGPPTDVGSHRYFRSTGRRDQRPRRRGQRVLP